MPMNGFRLSGSCSHPMRSVTFSSGDGLDEAAARATPTAAASRSSRTTTRDTLVSRPDGLARAIIPFPLVR